jgi:hypothetical protein
MRSKAPDQYRFKQAGNPWASGPENGMNGAFHIPLSGMGHRVIAYCIVSDGSDDRVPVPWEHVSVQIYEYGRHRIPTWIEMCKVKDIFWHEEECVVQYHPPKSEYVNCHPCVLHLWRYKGGEMPTPPKICV